ncbi:MAG TPA: chromate efflux transporter [Actinomycetes bacterium]|nr:chromate efflux transporter [Actinomycetes bacterium]
MSIAAETPNLRDAARTWGYVGINSFGGPAGQIAVMHRVVVDERKWIDEKRYLHALNFCMVLPGPEALQLAVYLGWVLNGILGGLIAGLLFVVPGLAVMAVLAAVYSVFGDVSWISAMLFGVQAAVIAIVVQALVRVGRRSLQTPLLVGLAVAAFIALALFNVMFPYVVIAALVIGWVVGRRAPESLRIGVDADAEVDHVPREKSRAARRAGLAAFAIWAAPLGVLIAVLGMDNVFSQEAWLFAKTAVLSFGGAYAALTYVSQQAVGHYGWIEPRDMVAGLGLAETTPGPLVLVMTFVGFVGAYRAADDLGMPAIVAGLIGFAIAAWATFVPSFGFVLLGAPSVEALRHNPRVAGALAAVTAAVVGVIADLALWFGLSVLFGELPQRSWGPITVDVPQWELVDWWAVALTTLSLLLVFRYRLGLLRVIGLAAASGLLLWALGQHP